ncbi:hypothetical protein PILCRDRAFT_3254 [Piloderma croceum F 1598]|uniref:Uncharacterized protein n=1 Tax=Piloderma croceum (strain F 1598) TaxID=765440 RepID=A0A0C3FUZ0_PILCF|nr:hypothetical protein PILCRDRAFT_3254 [Piloderma croceum F 1598]
MLYEYNMYGNYPPYEYAQPPPELDIHPNSAAAQLGLTPEQIRGVSEEQERWFREEYQQELEEDRLHRARVSTEHQEQDHEARWVPTPPISDFDPTPQTYEVLDEPPEDATSSYDNGPLNPELTPRVLRRVRHSELYVVPFDGCEPNDGANTMPEHDNMIKQLVRELVISDDAMGDWAEEMEGIELPQGEYVQTRYSPPLSAPSPAPQHQPTPPITIYLPPPINYAPPPTRHRPPRTHNTSRCPPFRLYMHPQHVRGPPRENRTGHVTAMRCEDCHATTRAARIRPPLYVPPTLCNDGETPYRSQQCIPWPRDVCRDPPPHRDPQQSPPRRSDSPNWRAPNPNCPTSCRSLSPPPQSPPAPPISPLCSKIPLMPPKHHTESQVVSELISIIKTTSDALQSIVWIAERLIRQVNAERRLAHKLR